MIAIPINTKKAFFIFKNCGWLNYKTVSLLIFYFLLSGFNAFLDGISVIFLVNLLLGKTSLDQSNFFIQYWHQLLEWLGYQPTLTVFLFSTIILLTIRMLISLFVYAIDGSISPLIRQKIQEKGFSQMLHGQWENLRSMRVGQLSGALTEEVVITTKYIYSGIRFIYFTITFFIFITVALVINTKLTLTMACAGLPIFLFLQWLFNIQSKLSAKQTIARQGFAADITERLTGLFQIKVGSQQKKHFNEGLRWQKSLTQYELRLGYYQAIINGYELFLPVVALVVFYFWSLWNNQPLSQSLSLLAQLSALGIRTLSQMNGLTTSWANMSRLSGSITPVFQIFKVPSELSRLPINNKINRVELKKVSYLYHHNPIINQLDLTITKEKPLVIRGPSGSGKTTIANIIASIHPPHQGEVIYFGEKGESYNATQFKPRVGYVTQDIYLFHGTVRQNLSNGHPVDDSTLWSCLDRVGAANFVRSIGGLEAPIVESGKSLSGGERRRLGIARALVENPDFMIFDEVTAGLDDYNRTIVHEAILHVAENALVIIITHEDIFDDLGRRLLIQPHETT